VILRRYGFVTRLYYISRLSCWMVISLTLKGPHRLLDPSMHLDPMLNRHLFLTFYRTYYSLENQLTPFATQRRSMVERDELHSRNGACRKHPTLRKRRNCSLLYHPLSGRVGVALTGDRPSISGYSPMFILDSVLLGRIVSSRAAILRREHKYPTSASRSEFLRSLRRIACALPISQPTSAIYVPCSYLGVCAKCRSKMTLGQLPSPGGRLMQYRGSWPSQNIEHVVSLPVPRIPRRPTIVRRGEGLPLSEAMSDIMCNSGAKVSHFSFFHCSLDFRGFTLRIFVVRPGSAGTHSHLRHWSISTRHSLVLAGRIYAFCPRILFLLSICLPRRLRRLGLAPWEVSEPHRIHVHRLLDSYSPGNLEDFGYSFIHFLFTFGFARDRPAHSSFVQ
jgi:hypothetical protein